jgi:predicted Ser/Thr protein kinase
LSFEEYLELVSKSPYRLLRGAPHYLLDALNHFGVADLEIRGIKTRRWKLFDQEFADNPQPLVGHEHVQQELFQILTGFVRAGKTDKLVVLHGPNGSAKSTIVRSLYAGLEHYSKSPDGLAFTFSWIFPHDSFDKGSLGLSARKEVANDHESYARLDQDKIGAVVRSELRENPIALIPVEDRMALFDAWTKAAPAGEQAQLAGLRAGIAKLELGHKNAIIYDALLNDYKGDWRKVLRHVRVERFYFSRRFRSGLVSVEPQFGVDAQLRQVTLDRSMAMLPPALQSLNLFQLEGDLVDANRGVIEYNDLLKRPLEAFKYLLGTTETGTVTLGHVVAFLDTVFLSTTNDRQLEAFREHPEYNSFKARMEFIKVPYLLRVTDEEKIYREPARKAAGPKEIMPHTERVLALWAVLTRLKRPLIKNKGPMLSRILEDLSPLAKAKLYDTGEIPENLNDEERRELKSALPEIIREQQNQPFYEGYLGASARELKVVLQIAAQNEQYPTLGPNSVFAGLEELIQRPLDFEYLRVEPNQGYHDYVEMIRTVRREWIDMVDREMQSCLEIDQGGQLTDFLERYVRHVTHHVRKEKLRNRITNQFEDPDANLMQEFEGFLGGVGDTEEFRRNLISRLGAWTIENPSRDTAKALPYEQIFPDLMKRLRARFHENQVAKIRAMGTLFLEACGFDLDALVDRQTTNEAEELATRVYKGMQTRYGYGPAGAKEALVELIQAKYR